MTIVVGHPPHKDDRSALQLAATLARSSGQDLRVVTVVPPPWPTPVAGGPDKEFARWSREQGEAATTQARAALAELCADLRSEVVTVAASSAAATLIEQAEQHGGSIVVVGSASHGAWGTVVVGSTADRLLHSSTVPVAVATRGHRAEAATRVLRATCAFRGDAASRAVLARTAAICRDVGASLRVATFAVRGRTMYPPEVLGEKQVMEAYVARTAAEQEQAVAELGDLAPADVRTAVATGATWTEALEQLEWDRGDVLVVGSSVAGLVSRLFLGSNATRIVRHSPVPVVVVPRGA